MKCFHYLVQYNNLQSNKLYQKINILVNAIFVYYILYIILTLYIYDMKRKTLYAIIMGQLIL